jgi:DNA polymerase-3 subunit epsilon
MLVVGDQDIGKLAGQEKSAKHRKAGELIASGFAIRILKESDFKKLVQLSDEFIKQPNQLT